MCRLSADRNLLVGIVALQMDFVTRDGLIAAMQEWLTAKSLPLGDILERSGFLGSLERRAIEALVEQHLARHRGDAAASLSALATSEATRSVLAALDTAQPGPVVQVPGDPSYSTVPFDSEATIHDPPGALGTGQRFEILRLHDQGGLGSVFLARDLELNRNVALKMLKDEISGDGQSRARFLLEAEITGNLEHPGIVPVHARGLGRDGLPYYAMRFVKGENLKEALDRFHKPRPGAVDHGEREREFHGFLRRFLTICDTVSYAHSRSVLHRDLKPRNVLLGPFGETLVVDWGLAKAMGRPERTPPSGETLRPASSSSVQATMVGAPIGTPAYMSPEQAKGEVERLDARSDVYGLGATLYCILAGRAPFLDQDGAVVIARVKNGEFPAPRQVNPKVPRALEAVCLKAMALEPGDRYPTVAELAADVERYLADQPVQAYPEPLAARAGRWLRRRKRLVAAAAALVLVAGLALAGHAARLAREKAHTEAALVQLDQQFTMTRTALNKLLRVAAERIASYPNSTPLRSELAKVVLEMYDKLVAHYPDNPDLQFELAQVHYLMGGLARIGEMDVDLVEYEKVLTLLEPLVRLPSTHAKAVRLIIKTRIERGTVLDSSERPRLAEAEYNAALALLDQYVQDLDPTEASQFRASALIDRCEIRLARGEFAAARGDGHEAVSLFEKVIERIAASQEDEAERAAKRDEARLLLAMALTDRGQALEGMNEVEPAEHDYRAAVETLDDIREDSAYLDDFRSQSASSSILLGGLLAGNPQRGDEARKRLDESIAALETLVKKQPDRQACRQDLVKAFLARASLAMNDNARADLDQAGRLLDTLHTHSPETLDYVSLAARRLELRAQLLRKSGDQRQADALIRQAIERLEGNLSREPERYEDKRLVERLRTRLAG